MLRPVTLATARSKLVSGVGKCVRLVKFHNSSERSWCGPVSAPGRGNRIKFSRISRAPSRQMGFADRKRLRQPQDFKLDRTLRIRNLALDLMRERVHPTLSEFRHMSDKVRKTCRWRRSQLSISVQN